MVLGKCQPDEISVRRSWDDQLSVEQEVIGDKKLRISLACMWSQLLIKFDVIFISPPGRHVFCSFLNVAPLIRQ